MLILHTEFTSKMQGMSYQKGPLGTKQSCPGKGSAEKASAVSKHANLSALPLGGLRAVLSRSLGRISKWGPSISKNGSQMTLLHPGEYQPDSFMEKEAATVDQTHL